MPLLLFYYNNGIIFVVGIFKQLKKNYFFMKKYKIPENEPDIVNECEVLYKTATSTSTTTTDTLDGLTISQQKSLQIALNQLDNGNYVPHSEVVKMSKLWLKI